LLTETRVIGIVVRITFKKHNPAKKNHTYPIMKTLYPKVFCKCILILLLASFGQSAMAVNATAMPKPLAFVYNSLSKADTPKRATPVPKIKKQSKAPREIEDGIDQNVVMREKQEFKRMRDPVLNVVPVERLIQARRMRDQIAIRQRTAPVQLDGSSGKVLSGSAPSLSSISWNERGPTNVGGRTRALIFDLNDAANGYKKVWAGGVGGGLWYTNDITATPVQWNKVNDFFENIAISCIVQNPVNPQEIYAGTGEGWYNGDAIQGLGIWKTADGGATWNMLANTINFKFVNAVAVDKNGHVYAAVLGGGIQKSSDGGTTWNQVISSPSDGADLQLAANGDLYASTGVFSTGNIFVSSAAANGANLGNAGTWTNITPSTTGVITPSTTSWLRIKLATAPSNANIVYALFEGSTSYSVTSCQQYNRGTNTWTVKTMPVGSSFNNGQGWYAIAIAVDPNNANIVHAGSLDEAVTVNGGTSWAVKTQWYVGEVSGLTASEYVHADHHAYVYAPGSSSRFLIGCDGGIFYSGNVNAGAPGASFIAQNNGYDVTQFYSVALHPTNNNYALAGAQDNATQQFTSAGLNATVSQIGGDGAFCFIDQTNGNIQIGSYVYDNYYLSTDGGSTFNGLNSDNQGQFINPTDYDNNTKNLYSGGVAGSYFRIVNVLSPAYAEVSVPAFNSANITAVTVAPITANRVYFGLDNATIVRVDRADTGASRTTAVTKVLTTPAPAGASVSCVAVDPTSEDHILVTYFNYGIVSIYETKNANAATPTWTAVEGNLPDMPVRWALFFPGDATRAIIATELGVWTTDALNGASTTWNPSNSGLANVRVDMLKFRASDRTLAAATHGRGLFTTTLPSAVAAPTLSKLLINYGTLTPTFSPTTTNYTASVIHSVSAIRITPTASVGTSTITVNGVAVASGTQSGPVALAVGANAIPVVVTAAGGTASQTYTVNVTRLSNDAYLTKLTTTPLTTFTTVTGPGYKNYTTNVPNATAVIRVTPVTENAGATVTVNGTPVASGTASGPITLAVGPNTITVAVTSQDGTVTLNTIITVTRAPSNVATLALLSTTAGTISPTFSSTVFSYSVSVKNGVTSTTVKPTTTNTGATVTVNGTAVTSGSASGPIALNVGSNPIAVKVTAQDGTTTRTYTLTVTRLLPSNANLTGLTLSSGTLTPTFVYTTKNYTATVTNTTSSITVTPSLSDPAATVKVNGTTVANHTASAPIALTVGSNTITTTVTAQDGTTTNSYVVTVTRSGPVSNPIVPNDAARSTVTVDDIIVHQGLSPNGDGVNDFLAIDNISKYPDNKLTIINRSGALVYEAKGYDNATHVFDGHSNKTGRLQLPGTYYFSLEYTVDGVTKHKTGYVVLKY